MFDSDPTNASAHRVAVIGAGVGGLAAALRLQASGHSVTIFEAHDWPGGKMRAVPSAAGPVDAGPTVLTMRHVFDALFQDCGARFEDHVTLVREPLLARHFWPDGSRLDLTDDPEKNAAALEAFSGAGSRKDFERFSSEAKDLFDAFDLPMMQTADPVLPKLAQAAFSMPKHLPMLSPLTTLARHLNLRFSDKRLAQLFGRYATYVGGSPFQSPALLSLIWNAEAGGVWQVSGGMHSLAKALARRFQSMGGILRLGTPVVDILTDGAAVTGLKLANGETVPTHAAIFNGDPRALATGALGPEVVHVAKATRTTPRSLSARVWSFAARVTDDPGLAHHNVFFGQNPREEFDALRKGCTPQDPTLYICAEDRGCGQPPPAGAERFEIILNAPPLTKGRTDANEENTCRQLTFPTLARFGLSFDKTPSTETLTTPTMFDRMFPGSAGSLYGQSPHGMTASLKRPRARTAIRGLYLAGGGCHPGAGVPMAALSGRFAAEAMMQDLVST